MLIYPVNTVVIVFFFQNLTLFVLCVKHFSTLTQSIYALRLSRHMGAQFGVQCAIYIVLTWSLMCIVNLKVVI